MKARSASCAVLLLVTCAVQPGPARAVATTTDELQAALRLTPDLDRGARLFEMCAACHGVDGAGAPDGTVPAIAGQPVSVLMKQIIEFRHEARLNIRMEHFVDRHHLTGAQQLADVAAYVNSLMPRTPVPREGLRVPGPGVLQEGAALYGRLCSSCHGAEGAANAAAGIPRLAGQHVEYLTEQLHDAAEGRRPEMGRDHARLLLRLTASDRDALAAYLSQLVPAPGGSAH